MFVYSIFITFANIIDVKAFNVLLMMNLNKYLLAFLLLVPSYAICQVTPTGEIVVEVSKEKKVVDGKTYYLHTVKKGENMFRICKAYNVTQKDIVIANPDAMSGVIKEGQVLNIPADSGASKNIQKIESEKFIYHVAEEGQTIFFLTQKYKISREDLIKYNPDLEFSPLQVGQLVNIPKTADAVLHPTQQISKRYTEHKVKRRETKYGISKQYDITVDELIDANPSLNTEEPKSGQILRIPEKNGVEIVSVPVMPKTDTLIPTKFTSVTPCDSYKSFSESYNVALLMPLYVEQNQTLAMIDSVSNKPADKKRALETNEVITRTTNMVEYYQGAMLAVDSLKKAGMSLKLYIYDTDRNPQKLQSILNKPEMAKMDLIIGPFYTDEIEKASAFALKNKIKLISPLSMQSAALTNNPYIFQVNPAEAIGADAMLRYISGLGNKNIVLVNSNKPGDLELIELYRSKLKELFQNDFKEFSYSKSISQINLLLAANTDNIMIVPSEDVGFISSVFQSLNLAARKSSIKVFGLPYFTKYGTIELEYFHNLEFHYYSTYHVDYKSPQIRNFISKYHHFYDSEPNNFSRDGYNFGMMGYDVTFYFLSSLGKLGKSFENCIGQKQIDLLHTNIIFERLAPECGFMNKGVNILKYTKDYNITKIN